MAHARVEILAGRYPGQGRALLEGVHRAIVDSLQVPEDDPLVRLVEHASDHFIIPGRHHTDDCVIVEIVLFEGRSLDTKRGLYAALFNNLCAVGVPAREISIVLAERSMENWAVGGPTPASETDVGFEVNL